MTAVAPSSTGRRAVVSRPRDERLELLSGGSFDVLVIGGGVIGAATAWAAARAGASVALVDRGDAAGATSSASSKLIHGGLRYLGLGDIRLVREAHRERGLNARLVAPHLVRKLRFVLPVGEDAPYPAWQLRAGVLAYSALSGFRDGKAGKISYDRARSFAPGLGSDRSKKFVSYHDHQTDDARLVLAALRTAERFGALWVNYTEVESLRTVEGRVVGAELRDLQGGRSLSVDAAVVVNASGPWVDHVRRLENPHAEASVQLSKGAHLVLETDLDWHAAVTSPLAGGRVSFAIPWHGMLLLGTTDEPYEGDPGAVAATPADESQILAEAGRSLDAAVLRPERITARFAGLRVLPLSTTSTAGTKRETVVSVGSGGMISVAGGKLTTWRQIGINVATRALTSIDLPAPTTEPAPLLGAADPDVVAGALGATHPELTLATRLHLAHQYGSLANDVLEPARTDSVLYEPIVEGAPDLLAQARYAVDYELAQTTEDILRRRTTIAIRGLDAAARDRVAPYLPAAAVSG